VILRRRYNPRRTPWLQTVQTVQPVEELYQHLQRILLTGLHRFARVRPSFLHVWALLEFEVLPLERDGVVEEELRSTSEFMGDRIQGEVPVEGVQDIGEH